jgi:LysR family hydrogen peroxide-inducible transcriptional activator
LADLVEIPDPARRSQDPEAGKVALGLFPTLGPYLLPHVVPAIRARFPELELLLVEEKSDVLLERLQQGRLDAALLALPVGDDQLHVEFLFEEPFVLAVPETHPLAGHGPIALDDLADEHLLLLADGHCLRDQALDVCHLSGAGEKGGFQATSLETLRQMVAANVGVTLLPTLAVKPPVARSENIHLLGFRDSKPSRQIAMVWRRSSAMADFLQQFAQVCRELPQELFTPTPDLVPAPRRQAAKKSPGARR